MQLGWKNQRRPGAMGRDYTSDQAVELVKDCFAAATERDIYTGDSVVIFITDSNGTRFVTQPLKSD